MTNKEEIFDVEEYDLIDEAYDRVDVLVDLLVSKGVLKKGEYEAKLNAFLDKKAENNQ